MEPGVVLRAAREAAGVSLRAMTERTFYSKSYLSQIETGQRPVPAGVVAAYQRVLGADLGRLDAVAHTPAGVDSAALSDVSAILAATRRIEDGAGAVAVLPAARGIATMAESFAREARNVREPAAALASEIVQYRGWLEHAIGGDATARRTTTVAVGLAQQSGDPDRLAHSLGFLGYVTTSTGDYDEMLALSDAAVAVRGGHPIVRAYSLMRRAELLAAYGESREAQRTLSAADETVARADGMESPASLYWWTPGFGGVQRAGVLAELGYTSEAAEEAAAGLTEMPAEHRRSEWLASALRRVDPDMTPDA